MPFEILCTSATNASSIPHASSPPLLDSLRWIYIICNRQRYEMKIRNILKASFIGMFVPKIIMKAKHSSNTVDLKTHLLIC